MCNRATILHEKFLKIKNIFFKKKKLGEDLPESK